MLNRILSTTIQLTYRLAARSPVFSHLSATLSGLSTIRSCGLQHRLAAEFDELQNVHSGVWQLATTANTALGLWLDCVSGLFVAFVTFSFIGLYGGKSLLCSESESSIPLTTRDLRPI